MEQMEFYQQYVRLADQIWRTVSEWKPFSKDTLGKQWVRAVDSIGANLVEGDGRYTKADGLHFLVIARASARETRYWLERAAERGLLPQEQAALWLNELTTATRRLNTLITYRRSHTAPTQIRESEEPYDPFHNPPNT